jgi:hypothetical protein
MFAILYALGMFVADLLKSRCWLEAENLFLRHQLNNAMRRSPPRFRLRGSDRALLKNALMGRAVQRYGTIAATPVFSGLHHRCARI